MSTPHDGTSESAHVNDFVLTVGVLFQCGLMRRALTLCCCHKTARVCLATSCGASFIQFRFHAMEAAWSMACVILPLNSTAAKACAVLLASLWFEVSPCRVTNQIHSPPIFATQVLIVSSPLTSRPSFHSGIFMKVPQAA